jgi:hypothetical protein
MKRRKCKAGLDQGVEGFTLALTGGAASPCPYHLSYPRVLMMKSAEEGNGLDRSDSLHRPA